MCVRARTGSTIWRDMLKTGQIEFWTLEHNDYYYYFIVEKTKQTKMIFVDVA